MNKVDFAVGIGRRERPGDSLHWQHSRAHLCTARLHLNAYNAYQSIIRGGHTFLTIRVGDGPVLNMATRSTCSFRLSRHDGSAPPSLKSGACAVYDKRTSRWESGRRSPTLRHADEGIDQGATSWQSTPLLSRNAPITRHKSEPLETVIARQLKRKATRS